jgi:hypothetical protein
MLFPGCPASPVVISEADALKELQTSLAALEIAKHEAIARYQRGQ